MPPRQARASSVTGTDVALHGAFRCRLSGAKNGNAVALRVVPIASFDNVAIVAVVNIESAPVNAGTVRKKCFVIANGAIAAHPRPDCVWRTDRFGLLHPCAPCDAVLDQPVAHLKKNDAITRDVVNN